MTKNKLKNDQICIEGLTVDAKRLLEVLKSKRPPGMVRGTNLTDFIGGCFDDANFLSSNPLMDKFRSGSLTDTEKQELNSLFNGLLLSRGSAFAGGPGSAIAWIVTVKSLPALVITLSQLKAPEKVKFTQAVSKKIAEITRKSEADFFA